MWTIFAETHRFSYDFDYLDVISKPASVVKNALSIEGS